MTRRRTLPLLAGAAVPVAVVAVVAAAATLAARTQATPGTAVMRFPAAVPHTAQQGATGPELTVLASGDVLLHSTFWAGTGLPTGTGDRASRTGGTRPATPGGGHDFRGLFTQLRDVVRAADLAVCHLETPVGEPGGPFSGYPRFTVPPQIVPALADAGYDTCSTASNHTLDAGEAGVRRTLDALDAAGIAHAGSARSAAEHGTPTLLTVHGIRVAHLAYTFSLNGLRLPAGRPWLANELRADAILAEAARARRGGAQIVLVSMHWGTEYQQAADAGQAALARRLLASPDIDLLLGHHAHVVQPFERIGDRWVVYGMGNLVAHQPQLETTQDGVLARITLRRGADGRWRPGQVEALPTWMDLSGTGRVVLVPAALDDPATPAWLREACLRSLRRTTAALTSRGATTAGLVVRGSLRRG